MGCLCAQPEPRGRLPLLPQLPLFLAFLPMTGGSGTVRAVPGHTECPSHHLNTHPPPHHGVYNWLRLAQPYGPNKNYRTGCGRSPRGTCDNSPLASSRFPGTFPAPHCPGYDRWGSSSSSRIYTPYLVDKTWDLVSRPLPQRSRILPRINASDVLIPEAFVPTAARITGNEKKPRQGGAMRTQRNEFPTVQAGSTSRVLGGEDWGGAGVVRGAGLLGMKFCAAGPPGRTQPDPNVGGSQVFVPLPPPPHRTAPRRAEPTGRVVCRSVGPAVLPSFWVRLTWRAIPGLNLRSPLPARPAAPALRPQTVPRPSATAATEVNADGSRAGGLGQWARGEAGHAPAARRPLLRKTRSGFRPETPGFGGPLGAGANYSSQRAPRRPEPDGVGGGLAGVPCPPAPRTTREAAGKESAPGSARWPACGCVCTRVRIHPSTIHSCIQHLLSASSVPGGDARMKRAPPLPKVTSRKPTVSEATRRCRGRRTQG